MKFRKKPLIVEATQWFKMGDHPAVKKHDREEKFGKVYDAIGDEMTVMPGDWIVIGAQGEHYICEPEIFEATYEAEE